MYSQVYTAYPQTLNVLSLLFAQASTFGTVAYTNLWFALVCFLQVPLSMAALAVFFFLMNSSP